MAFKSAVQYNEERYGNFFLLPNDGNSADVVFLYRDKRDVLIADTHYIKSADYSGYVHCNGYGCPVCTNAKNIRVQTKLFIPLYNITEQKIQFWDRSNRFEVQLMNDVFDKFPNPSEYVFRVTRQGAAGDINTKYTIIPIAKNVSMPYDKILSSFGITLPEAYDRVVREFTSTELMNMLNSNPASAAPTADYVPTPRAEYVPTPAVTTEPVSDFNLPPMEVPGVIPPAVSDLAAPQVNDLVALADEVVIPVGVGSDEEGNPVDDVQF